MSKARLGCIVLCTLSAWPGCCSMEPVPDYLRAPDVLGVVWAADGENYYIATPRNVIRWEAGAPVEVIYRGADVRELKGSDGVLRALYDGGVLVHDGTSWVTLAEIHNILGPVIYVTSEAVFAASNWQFDTNDIRTRIHRYDGLGWEVEYESGATTFLYGLSGRSETKLWAIGYRIHHFMDLDTFYSTPVLLRRGGDGWETMDSTLLGRPSADDSVCEGEVCSLSALWVDLEGRAHVFNDGPGVLVHDGVQSWIEELPVPAPSRVWRVDMSPDGAVYALASDESTVYLWVFDGSSWRSSVLASSGDFHIKGFSAYDGGAIITACMYHGYEAFTEGVVIRARLDASVEVIASIPLTGTSE